MKPFFINVKFIVLVTRRILSLTEQGEAGFSVFLTLSFQGQNFSGNS